MFSFLKNHPFEIEAFFESSLVLTYAVPKEQLEQLIPACLRLDTFENKYAFVAVAMVQTKGLRPKGFPKFMGNDFFLIGYRVFVRYTTNAGKELRGLYILKSETDKKRMEVLGNIFTHYNYTTTDIIQTNRQTLCQIQSSQSDFSVTTESQYEEAIPLPANSPFANWKEARRFAGPLPFTFTYNPNTKQVLIIEGVRQHWIPRPVKVVEHRFSFLREIGLEDAVLANTFIITDVPYHWKKGRIEPWG